MRSTTSAPDEPVATSTVAFAGRVKTVSRLAERVLSVRRVGATICAATDRSRRASSRHGELHGAGRDRRPGPAGPDAHGGHRELEHAAAGRHRDALQPERDGLPRPGGQREQEPGRVVQVRERVDVGAVLRMHLEVEVVGALGVAGVAVVADLLARLDPGPVLEPVRVGDAGHALAAVVALRREVVVEVDVEVGRAARAVEVEHAAGAGRGRPELDLAVLGRDGGRAPGRQDVVPRVAPLAARIAVVVRVRRLAHDREDDRLRPLAAGLPGSLSAGAADAAARPRP